MKTTEKQTAASFNLYTGEDLPSIYKSEQKLGDSVFNYSERINSATMDLPDSILNEFNPVLLFEAREQKRNFSDEIELYYIENFYTCFFTPNGNICLLRFNSKNKKYYFMPHYGHYREIQNISHYKRTELLSSYNLKEPQHIGKFTAKKINDWLNYCDLLISAQNEVVKLCDDKNYQIEREIADFCVSSGGEVYKYASTTEVTLKNFIIRFDHNRNEQYLSKKITFNGDLNDVLELVNGSTLV